MTTFRTEPLVHPSPAGAGGPPPVGAVWALLMINVLGFNGVQMVIPFPHTLGLLVTMGALVTAFGLSIVHNPRLQFRPCLSLMALSLLLVVSIAASLRLESGMGALFRCFRGTIFLATLWLLTRWWRGELHFVRYHIRVLGAVLLLVLLGLAIAPGKAMSGPPAGRLIGTLWPIPAPQVGEYAAVLAGLTIVLWLTHRTDRRSVLCIVPLALGVLLLSRTRTALFALLAALVVTTMTLSLSNARARRALTGALVLGGLGALTMGSLVQGWLARGQDAEQLANLTGRQQVWDTLLAHPRSVLDQLIGVGLTNKSFGGLPIDSSWLAVYQEQGLIGVTIVAVLLVGLLITAALRPPSPARACALFLILYVAVSSYTEVGLGDVSPYFLHLAVATSLLTRGGCTGGTIPAPLEGPSEGPREGPRG